MSKLGVHALVWVGGWSEADCTKAIRSTAELGYDFIEIPLLEPVRLPGRVHARPARGARARGHRLLGLSAATDISSEDPDTVARGEDLLNTVSVVRDLGATHFCGVIHSALQKYMAPRTERGVANVVEVLRRVAEKARVGHHGGRRGRTATRRTSSTRPRRRWSCSTASASPTPSPTSTPTT